MGYIRLDTCRCWTILDYKRLGGEIYLHIRASRKHLNYGYWALGFSEEAFVIKKPFVHLNNEDSSYFQ